MSADPPAPPVSGPGSPSPAFQACAALMQAARLLGVHAGGGLDAALVERACAEGARAGEAPWATLARLGERVGLRLTPAEGSLPAPVEGGPCLLQLEQGWSLLQAGEAPPEGVVAWGYLSPLAPASAGDGHGAHDHVSPWSRIQSLVRVERREIGAMFVYASLGALLALAVPVAVQSLVNTLLFGTLVAPVLWLSVLVAAMLLGAAVLQLTHVWTVELLQRRIFVNLVAELAWKLPRAELEALDGEHRFRLGNRFLDVVVVQKAVAKLLTDGIGGAVSAVAGTVLLGLYHPYLLGYAAALWLLVALIVVGWGESGVRSSVRESYAKHAVAGWIEELLVHPHAVRGAGGQAWAWSRGDALAGAYLDARQAHFRVWFTQVAALLGLHAVASAALLSIGGFLVVGGELTVGQLMAAELVVTAVLGNLAKVGKQLEKVYDLVAGLDKIGHLLEIPVRAAAREARRLPPGPSEFAVDGLSYRYPDGHVAFADLSFRVPPGSLVAVSGPTGSGRRTLLEVLAGQRAPSSGTLALGGMSLPALESDALAGAVALVRGPDVVEGTVEENVHLGRADVAATQVDAALAAVGLDQVVEGVGRETVLSPDGRPLGGGQALRLALARALAGQPRVLLVDARHEALRGHVAALKSPERVTVVLGEEASIEAVATHRVRLGEGMPRVEVVG